MAATPSGTRQYFQRMKSQGLSPLSTPLGATDLEVSRVGFGGYRIHEFEPDHREALREALLTGCNLIDTSSNYTDGSSERLVGEVVSELIASGHLKREELVIVTKAGYVQGQNLKEAKARQTRSPFPDMVEFQPDCWHNISPEFLEHQISRSLERLRLDAIDVLLLHNPEYFLKASGSRDVYYQRIEKAFRFLEKEVERGRIRFYGVSSNTLPVPESRSDFTSLTRLHEIASAVQEKNHFAVIQFPFNLFESGAALIANNKRQTVLEFASQMGLGVLTNRPFNSFHNGRLMRLTSFPTHDEVEVKGHLHTVLGRAIEMEKRFLGFPKTPQGLQWAHALRDRLSEIDDLLGWKDALFQQIYPSIRQALSRLNADQAHMAPEYENTMQELLKLITFDLENLAERKSQLIGEQIQLHSPDLSTSPTLSRKMLRIYTALPQIHTVLIGMRTPAYVRDALAPDAPLSEDNARAALLRMQRHRS